MRSGAWRPSARQAWAASLGMALLAAGAMRARAAETDLREFSVGMPFSALPPQGYTGFACAARPGGAALDGWAGYRDCPADDAGRREISFRYDDGGENETKVSGQPVRLSLLLGQDGTVEAIRMQTDPAVRLFQHKKGYRFGEQVMARYGAAGWVCRDAKPAGNEEPVGGVFLREHCEKTVDVRHLVVDRELYRDKERSAAGFTSGTTFTVSLVKAGVKADVKAGKE